MTPDTPVPAAPAAAPASAAPPAAALGAMPSAHMEGWQGLLLRGWVADTPAAREPLRLRGGGVLCDVPLRRTSRRDVADALHLADEMVGVEMEVPGSLWAGVGDAPELALQVEGRAGPIGGTWTLRRDELATRLAEALALDDPARRAHQALLAMEHIAWARAWDDVVPASRQALRLLAESAGVAAWLHDDPAALAARAEPPRRAAWRISPRGRLGRWLARPGNGERALQWLAALRRRPALAAWAERWEVALTRATGLFDKACYDAQVPEAGRGGLTALRHYVRLGDARGMVPMVLFDPRHYTGQLPGRRHPGVNRLLHYALVGRPQGLSPCAWFDPAYYLQANPDVAASGQDPLVHLVHWGHAEGRRTAPRFEPSVGARPGLLQRLGAGGGAQSTPLDPLQRFVLDGLPADAQPAEPGRLPWAVPWQLDGRDYLDLAPWRTLRRPEGAPTVDVIVPVYAGAQETLRCLWSVLSAPVDTLFELVVVDDCSPEPALSTMLRELAALGLLRLIVNESNRGFVASVNAGLALSWERDVVILNADTRVHAGWLDRLVAHGRAEPRAASVTPLSNNATVCSYPRPQHSNWERLEVDDGLLDALAAQANAGQHVEVPTGVGFCMWMRRAAIDAVGLLDVERFGRGYGEENDWCMRANAAGWVQLVACDVFVMHQGSVSFAGEAGERTRAGLAVLRERHPDYLPRIAAWIAADPLAPARARLDAARLRRVAERSLGAGLVLSINHARGGGTARHEAESAARLAAERSLGTVALRPSRRPGCVALAALDGALDLPNLQALPVAEPGGGGRPAALLVALLRALDVREVHLHHLADHAPALHLVLPALCEAIGAPLHVTLHDYHLVCPRINLVDGSGRYCGEPDRPTCDRCLQADGLAQRCGPIAGWRTVNAQLLKAAQRVTAPDLDVAARMVNYVPSVRVEVVPHEPLVLPADRPVRGPVRHVLVIGALSAVKGLHVLRGLAGSRAAAESGVRFTLLGHSPDDAGLRAAGVQVLGAYEDDTLPARIAELAPDLILLPSVWPETFCYVLTPAATSGRRVAVFDLGAQARRLKEAGADAVYLPVALADQPEALMARLLA